MLSEKSIKNALGKLPEVQVRSGGTVRGQLESFPRWASDSVEQVFNDSGEIDGTLVGPDGAAQIRARGTGSNRGVWLRFASWGQLGLTDHAPKTREPAPRQIKQAGAQKPKNTSVHLSQEKSRQDSRISFVLFGLVLLLLVFFAGRSFFQSGEIDRLMTSVDELQGDLEDFQQGSDGLARALTEARAKLEQEEELRAQAETEVGRLSGELEERNRRIETLSSFEELYEQERTRRRDSDELVLDLQRRNGNLADRLADAEEERGNSDRDLVVLTEEIARLREEIRLKASEISSLEEQWTVDQEFARIDRLRDRFIEGIGNNLDDNPDTIVAMQRVLIKDDADDTLSIYNLIAAQMKMVLDEDASLLFLVVGHADPRGGRAENQALSRRRAEAVRNTFITELDIAACNLQVAAYGEDRPFPPGLIARIPEFEESGDAEALDVPLEWERRVEIVVTGLRPVGPCE